MKKHEYLFEIKDPITLALVKQIVERSKVGQKEYNGTIQSEIDSGEKNASDYLIDLREELVDAVMYANAALESLKKLGIDPALFKDKAH